MKNFAIDTFYFSAMIIAIVAFLCTGLWVYLADILFSKIKTKLSG